MEQNKTGKYLKYAFGEFVSKLLGHSNMKITQDSYGKVVEKKISLEMERLKGKNSN